jgi:hypothetical protein
MIDLDCRNNNYDRKIKKTQLSMCVLCKIINYANFVYKVQNTFSISYNLTESKKSDKIIDIK